MNRLMGTREVAKLLGVNEKMVYTLISEKGLPATKITGKWLFPPQLVERWVENHTVNLPESATRLPPYHGLLILAGSNDLLLDRTIADFNSTDEKHMAVFGNLGSMGGIRALRQHFCHIATSHLLQENEEEYNFDFASTELEEMPAVVNFCRRQQGILLRPGNPKQIASVADLAGPDLCIVNRPLGTGTRLLFDRALEKAGVKGSSIPGYQRELHRHMDVGLEVLGGRADAAPGIRPVASLLGLDFLPLRWERFDLLIAKERFFDQGVQRFLGLLHERRFSRQVEDLEGYDTSLSGKVVFPGGGA